ncbi:MAG: translation initiation factor IF-2 N-terminal domain-containing protein, partial [Terriglobales bacterium]
MSKIRINDLARELEVKSREILDVLTTVGVTEKKTHSSSLEDHEADLVRKHLRGRSDASSGSSRSSYRTAHGTGEDEIKTKIDLSHISQPGDVLRAIQQRKAAVETPAARPVAKQPAVETKVESPAASTPPAPSTPKAVPPKPPAEAATPAPPQSPSTPRLVTPASVAATYRPPSVVVIPPKTPPPAATTPAAPSSSAPPAAVPPRATPPSATATAAPVAPSGVTSGVGPTTNVASTLPSNVTQMPAAPPRSSAPIAPPPRMIMPQTGPRPVYKAPILPPSAAAPSPSSRPAPGRPIPGQPIFQ